jgi:uncharacterized membrane protein YphA (DoxX/SURF4 family)/peroxiredoxin
MQGIALAARILLALVFALAGVGKLLDQSGGRRALAGFGVPDRWSAPAARALPAAELAIAVALVPTQTARWGALAALCLLLAFTAAIARATSRGVAPDCHCFGQLSSAPAGWRTLTRNVVLAGVAALLVFYGPGEGPGAWVSGHSTAAIVAVGVGICLAVLAALLARLWRENRGLRHELARVQEATALLAPGLPIGAPAPKFSLLDADGTAVSLDGLLARGLPLALVFVSPSCEPCAAMLSDLARWQATLSERITIAVLSTGKTRENRLIHDEYGLANVLVQNETEVFDAYRAAATPSVVIVTADGRIGSGTRSTRPIAEAVIRSALRSDRPVPAVATLDG